MSDLTINNRELAPPNGSTANHTHTLGNRSVSARADALSAYNDFYRRAAAALANYENAPTADNYNTAYSIIRLIDNHRRVALAAGLEGALLPYQSTLEARLQVIYREQRQMRRSPQATAALLGFNDFYAYAAQLLEFYENTPTTDNYTIAHSTISVIDEHRRAALAAGVEDVDLAYQSTLEARLIKIHIETNPHEPTTSHTLPGHPIVNAPSAGWIENMGILPEMLAPSRIQFNFNPTLSSMTGNLVSVPHNPATFAPEDFRNRTLIPPLPAIFCYGQGSLNSTSANYSIYMELPRAAELLPPGILQELNSKGIEVQNVPMYLLTSEMPTYPNVLPGGWVKRAEGVDLNYFTHCWIHDRMVENRNTAVASGVFEPKGITAGSENSLGINSLASYGQNFHDRVYLSGPMARFRLTSYEESPIASGWFLSISGDKAVICYQMIQKRPPEEENSPILPEGENEEENRPLPEIVLTNELSSAIYNKIDLLAFKAQLEARKDTAEEVIRPALQDIFDNIFSKI